MIDGAQDHDGRAVQSLDGARSGDEGAWAGLVHRLEPLVYAVAWRNGVRGHDIDDVVQNVWLALWRHLGDLRDPGSLRAWAAAIARNAAYETLRSRRRTVAVDFTDERLLAATAGADGRAAFGGGGPAVDDRLRSEEQVRAVRAGLAELAPAQRDLLLLLAADPPLPYREISRRLGIPVGSIGPTRARLLKRLADSDGVRRLGEPATEQDAIAA